MVKEFLKKMLPCVLALAVAAPPGSLAMAEEENALPKNPVHHCAKDEDSTGMTDTTEWSYIYFGNYPQTEVTGAMLTEEITGAAYDENGDATTGDGSRYRRISKEDVTDDDNFGDAEYRYFKWEKIRWRVLSNDGSTLFVMADKGLDCRNYLSWDDSEENGRLCDWLENIFYRSAFSADEQEAVVPQTVGYYDRYYDKDKDTYHDVEIEKNAHVYLLSLEEVTSPEYGFCKFKNFSVASGEFSFSLRAEASDYAYRLGAPAVRSSNPVLDNEEYEGACSWWLRTLWPNENLWGVSEVCYYMFLMEHSPYFASSCVPAMHIDLNSELWSPEPDFSVADPGRPPQGAEGETPVNPEHRCTGALDLTGDTDDAGWDYIYFGSYPQTEVTGKALTSAITGASYDSSGDAWVKGRRYRRISKNDTNNEANFGSGAYRYFKWEQIRWRVLQNDGETLFVMADQGLDCKNYHGSRAEVTWEQSDIRNWLNSTFCNMAFSGDEQKGILSGETVNADNPDYGTEGGNQTEDKVFLPSIEEVSNPSYGFCSYLRRHSYSRRVPASDYAYAMGALVQTEGKFAGKCQWMLRSPGYEADYASSVSGYGFVDRHSGVVSTMEYACVPCLRIDLSSGQWSNDLAPEPPQEEEEKKDESNQNPPTQQDPPSQQKPQVPAKPINLAAPKLTVKIDSANGVRLSWKKVKSASGYYVYRSASKNGKYKRIKKLKGTSYINEKLKSGKTYYYKVAAYKGKVTGRQSKAVSRKIIGKPARLKMSLKVYYSTQTFTISWSKGKRAEKVEILRSEDNGAYKPWRTVKAKMGKQTFSYAAFPREHKYKFAVRAIYVRDGKKISGDLSDKYPLRY